MDTIKYWLTMPIVAILLILIAIVALVTGEGMDDTSE